MTTTDQHQAERTTRSGFPLQPVYQADSCDDEPATLPGEPPFIRGIDARGYRDHSWVMGQYAGFGSAHETNLRFRRLLADGGTGLSVALDLPTQMGLDSDHELSDGEVGKVGVAIDSLADMEVLFDGIDLGQVRQLRTTANASGPIWTALVVAACEKQGVDPNEIGILIQNDVLKEYVARGTYIVPPRAGLRLAGDTIEYCSRHLPHWTPLAMSGYHIRESGATAPQEIALTFANGIAYCAEVQRRGVSIDSFGSSLFTFLSAGTDLFEEVAKFRSARDVWCRTARWLGAVEDRTTALRIFAFTAGSNLTAQQPLNNLTRVSIGAVAAVLGGCQTLHTSAYDEAYATPTEKSATLALRTQQIVLHESGCANVTDPLGGSYFVESLTSEMSRAIDALMSEIAERGGAVECIESGWFADLIADSAYADQLQLENRERHVVGVNIYRSSSPDPVEVFQVDLAVQADQIRRLHAVRASRDEHAVADALHHVADALRTGANCVPSVLDAVRAYATVGEIGDAFRQTFGRYQDNP